MNKAIFNDSSKASKDRETLAERRRLLVSSALLLQSKENAIERGRREMVEALGAFVPPLAESRQEHQVFAAVAEPTGLPWFTVKAATATEPAEILIYGMIGKNWLGDGTDAKDLAAELKNIPRDQKITLRVNSPGGNVNDALAIHSLLSERRDKLTAKVDGVAASAASFIILAASTVEMPKGSLLMIHNPWTMAEGDANQMRKVAAKLDTYRNSMCSIYEAKTGKSREDLCAMMDKETWMSGQEAKDHGFADTVTEDTADFQACADFDFARFRHAPEHLKQQPQNKGNEMNRQQIVARLNQLGVKFKESATTAALQKLLATAERKAKAATGEPEASADTEGGAAEAEVDAEAEDAEADAEAETAEEGSEAAETEAQGAVRGEASTPARQPDRPRAALANDPAFRELQRNNRLLMQNFQAEQRRRVTAQVDRYIAEDRLPAAQRDKWVARAVADEKVLDDIAAFEQRPPGNAPVSHGSTIIISDSPKDIERGVLKAREAVTSWLKGNSVEPKAIAANALVISKTIEANRKKLDAVLATNTVDPALKRNVILSDLMRAFQRKLLVTSVFSTRYTNVPLEGTAKVEVPFYDLDTVASRDFNPATGYLFPEDTTVGVREININKRKYKTMDFSSETFRRQPYFRPDISMGLKVEQLAVDIWTDILSVVKADPYGASIMDVEAGSFDTDDLISLRRIVNNLDWPDMGRSCVLGTDHEAALLSDDALKHFLNSGSTAPLRDGSTGNLLGFAMYYSPRIPNNSEDLAGFVCLPQAALVATAPIAPAPGVRQLLLAYDLVIDPQTGIAFEYRYGADTWMDKDREVVECNYGYAKGNQYALRRITAGSAEFSSSSSLSSVNSSSSSSSSPSF